MKKIRIDLNRSKIFIMNDTISLFVSRHGIDSDGEKELIDLFNQSLVHISKEILSKAKTSSKTSDSDSKSKSKSEEHRFASKKAEEYAHENDISLSDFSEGKITKKQVEDFLRNRSKNSDKPTSNEESKTPKVSKVPKIVCGGITKKGEQCNRPGTECPDGSKKKYCFRHCDDWKLYECDSDSSDSEHEEEEELEEEELKP